VLCVPVLVVSCSSSVFIKGVRVCVLHFLNIGLCLSMFVSFTCKLFLLILYILWHIDPLLSNDYEISYYTTTVVR
jgi:hypothetical protein